MRWQALPVQWRVHHIVKTLRLRFVYELGVEWTAMQGCSARLFVKWRNLADVKSIPFQPTTRQTMSHAAAYINRRTHILRMTNLTTGREFTRYKTVWFDWLDISSSSDLGSRKPQASAWYGSFFFRSSRRQSETAENATYPVYVTTAGLTWVYITYITPYRQRKNQLQWSEGRTIGLVDQLWLFRMEFKKQRFLKRPWTFMY